nr:natural killer cell receptor 2B4-like [Danio rerio]|eukprot:XP_021325231.1 natural killer cell receptor 2B4-like [Danio rerio]
MSKRTFDMFMFICLYLWSLPGVCGDGVKSVLVTEGDSVTLKSALVGIQSNDLIMLRFEPGDILLAKISEKREISYSSDGRLRDRLKLDSQTGSLIITDSRTTDSGLYKVTTVSLRSPINTFNITVYARLLIPVLKRDCSSSVQYCSVVCSVVNVSAVSLSWYKGNSVLSSISVSDLSISLSLPLEVEYQDKNTYSCVVNNTISNLTTHLNITEHCLTCSDLGITLLYTVLPSAGGFLIIVSVVFCIFRKQRKIGQGVEPVQKCEAIPNADPTFYKRKAQKMRALEEEDVVYAGIVMKN